MMRKDYTSLFEQQSYNDALEYYTHLLSDPGVKTWDYVILTASNEEQAEIYRMQIDFRKNAGALPKNTHYAVLPDPDGKRVGSGGATLNAILYVKKREGSGEFSFSGKKILVIHSGGDSKRIPQYSACGKLFSPVPRVLPNGARSTLFDEFMIGMSTVAGRIESGMLVCSGDVLLLFNALQIDFYSKGAAALSVKESADIGKNHGVYLSDSNGNVGAFLHKQSVERLKECCAVDERGNVDIDTGAVILDSNILDDLCALTENDSDKFINERARLSFYADFLYPLASSSDLESFYKETPEGDFTTELRECRTALWSVLSKYSMKLIRLSPASFIHFGTTKELRELMADRIEDYRYLGWSGRVGCNLSRGDYSVSNSYISRFAKIGKGSYIEDCYIHHGSIVGEGCVLSGVTLSGETIPDGAVMHGLKLKDGKFVCRVYGVGDNPKEKKFFGKEISEPLWVSKIYPVCQTMEEAVRASLSVLAGEAVDCEKTSLAKSFANADATAILPWQTKLSERVKAETVLSAIDDKIPASEVGIKAGKSTKKHLLRAAEKLNERDLSEFGKKIRIYYYLYKLTGDRDCLKLCFDTISNTILRSAVDGTVYKGDARIVKSDVLVRLPVRVNWGGGWSDTPPYCLEHGGTVLNAAISLNGELPIEVSLIRLSENKIILSSTDIGAYMEYTDDTSELRNCQNPQDAFALHKAALVACGIIPYGETLTVREICSRLGGGIYFNTRVIDIPKGSGLGTSSILAGACVKGLYELIGEEISMEDMYKRVLYMEQLMSTGGGWQDQVGGLSSGIKMISSHAGLSQDITVAPLCVSDEVLSELDERFCLVYTGQRRLARNLLREVVSHYIAGDRQSVSVHCEIQRLAVLMRFELEKGNIDGFAELLNKHWELSKKLDAGCTNTCIDQILYSVSDLIDGRMICGAGGGGFLQILLKKGVGIPELQQRLKEVFQDSGVAVYRCRIVR